MWYFKCFHNVIDVPNLTVGRKNKSQENNMIFFNLQYLLHRYFCLFKIKSMIAFE